MTFRVMVLHLHRGPILGPEGLDRPCAWEFPRRDQRRCLSARSPYSPCMGHRPRASSGTKVWIALVFFLAVPAAAQTVNDPTLQVELVASGLSQPTTMAFIGNGDILVLQKANGQVRRIIGGVLQVAPALDVAVDSASERGLLGIALDPDFAVNRRVFLYYTESGNGSDTVGSPTPLGNRVYSYTWDGAALVNPVLVLDLPVLSGPN